MGLNATGDATGDATEDATELGGAWNFRDVGATADGATVLRPGRLFRSGELTHLDDAGRGRLARLGITDVADLRSRREVARRGPGRVPAGVEIHLLPFPDLADDQARPDGSAPHEQALAQAIAEQPDAAAAADAAAAYMIDEYRRFPALPGSRRAVHRVITLLTAGRPVLAHCFAGKDRTGFVVATVLEAAGVDRAAVVADYLRSNTAVPTLRARLAQIMQQRASDTADDTGQAVTPEMVTFTEARLSDEVLGVRPDYLAAARRSIDETYGSLQGYLSAAEITATDVKRLRAALLS